jgi:hypothetical protein
VAVATPDEPLEEATARPSPLDDEVALWAYTSNGKASKHKHETITITLIMLFIADLQPSDAQTWNRMPLL